MLLWPFYSLRTSWSVYTTLPPERVRGIFARAMYGKRTAWMTLTQLWFIYRFKWGSYDVAEKDAAGAQVERGPSSMLGKEVLSIGSRIELTFEPPDGSGQRLVSLDIARFHTSYGLMNWGNHFKLYLFRTMRLICQADPQAEFVRPWSGARIVSFVVITIGVLYAAVQVV